MIKYNHSDAWLLQSILYSSKEGSSSLKDIIAIGDVINHAIFAPGELQQGLIRLLNGNLINLENNRFSLTGSAKQDLSFLLESKMTVLDVRNEIAMIIGAEPWSPEDPLPEYEPDLEPKLFSMNEYRKAFKKYKKEFRKLYKQIEKEDKLNTYR